jgi:hypothetical protein
MVYEVMQRTPLLIRCLAVGSLALLLSLTITEDKSYRRQELQRARVRVMLGISQTMINHQKEIMAMKRHPAVFFGSSLFFAAALLAGCAAEPNPKAVSQSFVLTQHSVSSRDAGNLAFAYRRQAKVLRDVASRLEVEAALYQQQFGADHERTRESREAANAAWAAAEEADEVARTYQQQLPHGRVY